MDLISHRGKSGAPIKLKTNIFPLKVKAAIAYQYDVVMLPECPKRMAHRAWTLVQEEISKDHGNGALFVYDGGKIAYAMKDIPEMKYTLDVPKEDNIQMPPIDRNSGGGGGRGGRGGGRGGRGGFSGRPRSPIIPIRAGDPDKVGPVETVGITITRTAQVDLDLLRRRALGDVQEGHLHAEGCVSVVLRHLPSLRFIPVGQNLYTPNGRTPIGSGLEIWRGYHQSVRVMMAGHLGVNVDTAATVFRQGDISVIDYLLDLMNLRDPTELVKGQNWHRVITDHLKNLSVVTIHRGDQRIRFKIAKISPGSAEDWKFPNKDTGKETSVADYFREQYNAPLRYPFLPLAVKSNGKTAFPIECLKIAPAQRFMKRLMGEQTASMIRATCQKPQARQSVIQTAVEQDLSYTADNEFMQSFGVSIDSKMMEIPARVLAAPRIMLGDNRTSNGADGQFNIRGMQFAAAPELASYAFIFYTRVNTREAEGIRDELIDQFYRTGLNVTGKGCPVMVVNPDIHDNIRGSLQQASNEAQSKFGRPCQMIFCVIDKQTKGLYESIKRITLTQAGILSQCILSSNVNRGVKPQYASNLCLKVNVKLGGATNYVDKIPTVQGPTMFVGCDVTHAPPGSGAPSIACLAASVDPNATCYNTYLRQQQSRVEIVSELNMLFLEALDGFFAECKAYPSKIVFFRDGVGAGQMQEVKDKELAALKKALARRKLDRVPVIFIVVQKRHHVRFFPIDNNKDRSDNCRPGTIVDTDIMDSTAFNFILQSHAGIQGTSRPTVYNVLENESKDSADDIQQMCYNLCFLGERCTRTISIVAPVYRAHICAGYARMFLDQDDMVSVRSGDSGVSLLRVMPAIERTMYYM